MRKSFKTLKNLLTLALVICSIISLTLINANAGEANYTTSGIFKYWEDPDDGSIELVAITDTSIVEINLPSTVDGKTIKRIGYEAFKGCTKLEKITIQKSVTAVERYAFSDTAYYKNPSNWQNGLLYIGDILIEAQKNVSGNVSVKNGTRVLADYAFSECAKMSSVSLPESLKSIGCESFEKCTGLTTLSCPDGLETINSWSFSECTNLKTISLNDNLTYLCSTSFSKTAFSQNTSNWENGILYIDEYLINSDSNLSENPIVKKGTKLIASGAFSNKYNMKSITLPLSIKFINYEAFSGTEKLQSVYYEGTQDQRAKINIYDSEHDGFNRGNKRLLNAKWYYNSTSAYDTKLIGDIILESNTYTVKIGETIEIPYKLRSNGGQSDYAIFIGKNDENIAKIIEKRPLIKIEGVSEGETTVYVEFQDITANKVLDSETITVKVVQEEEDFSFFGFLFSMFGLLFAPVIAFFSVIFGLA